MTTILLIRHGETEYNRNGKMAGRMPGVPLNERGRKQAEAVAAALAKAPIKTIYSSPIERAQETASYLSKLLNLEIQIAEGVNETDIGVWTGRSVKQCARTKLWQTVIHKPSELTFPGGESFAGIQQRASAEVRAIAERPPDELVACYTHADIIRLIAANFLEMPLDAFQRLGSDNCSITVLHFGKDGHVSVPKINQAVSAVWPEQSEAKKNGHGPAAKATKADQ
jgi:probable phosphomutase (TIGR03848 family)